MLDKYRRIIPELNLEQLALLKAGRLAWSSGKIADHLNIPEAMLTVDSVSSPSNSAAFASKVTEMVDVISAPNRPTTVCFDSLTALLQYLDKSSLLKLVHVIIRELKSRNVTAHFHIDAKGVDQEVLREIQSSFDRIIDTTGKLQR